MVSLYCAKYSHRYRKQKQCTPVEIEITWPHLEKFSTQASIKSRNIQLRNADNLLPPQDISLQEERTTMSTSFIEDPLNTQTVRPLHVTDPRHYKYEVSPDGDSLQTFRSVVSASTATNYPYVPNNSTQSSPQTTRRVLTGPTNHLQMTVSETDSTLSNPQTTKQLVNISDQTNTKLKKTRTDGTESSNSWEVEKFEDSVAYKAKAKEMWKQTNQCPAKFQAVL